CGTTLAPTHGLCNPLWFGWCRLNAKPAQVGRDLLTVPTESDEYGPHNPIVTLAAVTEIGDYAVRAPSRLTAKSCLWSVIGSPCRTTGGKLGGNAMPL